MERLDWIVAFTIIGFGILALLVLGPVYRFLKREEKAAQRWTEENLDDPNPNRVNKQKAEPAAEEPSNEQS